MTETQWALVKRFMILVLTYVAHHNKSADMSREWWDAALELKRNLKES